MARRKKEAVVPADGVELHGHSWRYRRRVKEPMRDTDGNPLHDDKGQPRYQWRVVTNQRYPFEPDPAKEALLAEDDPLRKVNALINCNRYAENDALARKRPKAKGGMRDPDGTFLEWLIRYQVEALDLNLYEPKDFHHHVARINTFIDKKAGEKLAPDAWAYKPVKFRLTPRAATSIDHDKSQIRSIFRIAREHPEIRDMLNSHISEVRGTDFALLESLWSGGKAKSRTIGKVRDLFAYVYNHHEEFHEMKVDRLWTARKNRGDGEKEQTKKAIPAGDVAKIDAELVRLDPFVRAAIQFIRWTGCRRGEACKVKWENIRWPPPDVEALPLVLFERTKAKQGHYKERFTYLEMELVCHLAEYVRPLDTRGNAISYDPATFDWNNFNWPKKGFVFQSPHAPGQPALGGTIYTAVRRCAEHAGVSHAHPHLYRHTRATVLTALVPQAIAQELLGHDDAKSFEIYRHLAQEAGYMLRDRKGKLVSKEELENQASILAALRKLPKDERMQVFAELMRD